MKKITPILIMMLNLYQPIASAMGDRRTTLSAEESFRQIEAQQAEARLLSPVYSYLEQYGGYQSFTIQRNNDAFMGPYKSYMYDVYDPAIKDERLETGRIIFAISEKYICKILVNNKTFNVVAVAWDYEAGYPGNYVRHETKCNLRK